MSAMRSQRAQVIGGRKARSQGEQTEALVMAGAELWRSRGWRVRKRPTPHRRLRGHPRNKGHFIACYLPGAGVDIDLHRPDGPGGLLEIKGTSEASIPLSAIIPGQAAELDDYEQHGLLAAVVVRVRTEWWVLLWRDWHAPKEAPDRKSLAPRHLDTVGVRCPLVSARSEGRPVMAPDWIPGLSKLLKARAFPEEELNSEDKD